MSATSSATCRSPNSGRCSAATARRCARRPKSRPPCDVLKVERPGVGDATRGQLRDLSGGAGIEIPLARADDTVDPTGYGCHITVDYSEGKTDLDWITTANAREDNGLTADNPLGTNGLTGPGKVFEIRSYLRWEEPTLGINGKGRVSPLMPGCQIITTIIDRPTRRS